MNKLVEIGKRFSEWVQRNTVKVTVAVDATILLVAHLLNWSPETVILTQAAALAWLGLGVTQTVTANKRLTGDVFGPINGVDPGDVAERVLDAVAADHPAGHQPGEPPT